ncbi:DUF3324 domain-containing protein [Holzapfeliella sp. He02]|uniref:DUF3324 domain-containing protein n=1 Tax=Holzapfeliella saturejae TaxID=3082953 RepID=A0ABU8SFC8_9LACO
MKIKQIFLMLTLLLLSVVFSNTIVQAADESAEIPFSIEAIHPSNQLSSSRDASYLDLLISPQTSQTVSFNVGNKSSKEQHFIIELSNATTSNGLSIDYYKTDNHLIKSPKISEMISSSESTKKVSVPGNSTVKVDFKLNYPKEALEGVVLGGVAISQDPEFMQDSSGHQNNEGVGIKNRYRYALAIQLRSNEKINTTGDVRLADVKQAVDDYHPVLKTTLQNMNPAMISQVSTHSILKNQNGNVIESYDTSLGQVAPISQFDLTIPLSNGALKPGNYNISGEMTSKKSNQKWTWNKDFSINDENYKGTNEQDVNKETGVSLVFWLCLLIILLLLLLALLFIFIIWKRRKEDDEESTRD